MTTAVQVETSPGLASWLAEQGRSLVLTAHQSSRVFLIGVRDDGRLSVVVRKLERGMGIARQGQALWIAGRYQLHRFENVLGPGERRGPHDALYLPRASFMTGEVDAHDLGVDVKGRPLLVATRINALVHVTTAGKLETQWRPPWVGPEVLEDACHVNGLAMHEGRPRFVSSVSRTGEVDGWRAHRLEGGVVLDLASNEVWCEGLCMPHSPRMHAQQLWVLEAGSGYLGRVAHRGASFERVAFCPGFARGMTLFGDYAVVAHSASRWNPVFEELPFVDESTRRKLKPSCGLSVVDLLRGEVVHHLELRGEVQEIFDVLHLDQVRCPDLLAPGSELARRHLPIEEGLG